MKGIQRQTWLAPYVNEFIARQRLRKIGYSSDIDKLEGFKGEMFVRISCMFDMLEDEDHKRKASKHGRK